MLHVTDLLPGCLKVVVGGERARGGAGAICLNFLGPGLPLGQTIPKLFPGTKNFVIHIVFTTLSCTAESDLISNNLLPGAI